MADWFKDNASRFSGQLLEGELLSKHTYYRIGGPSKFFAIPKSLADVEWLAEGIAATKVPFFILGNGSNLLVADAGFSGLVIDAGRLNLEVKVADRPDLVVSSDSSVRIRTGASVAISTLLRKAAQMGWNGLEFLTGIPGTIGGVVSMNGGTHLGEVQSCLRRVEVLSLLPRAGRDAGQVFQVFEEDELRFQYRKNLFLLPGDLIYAAEWDVTQDDPAKVKSTIDQVLTRRKATQPLDFPSCGSVFKNPKASGVSAWQVIDRLGLRGFRIGGAQFSEQHSNFILNVDRAKASDVRALIELAKSRALSELGVTLEEEVIYL